VLTGFLGAGKTSTIRHLLETANGKRLALIINEFGDLGVDGEIVKGCGIEGCEEEDVLELANGCICCTVADEFLPTMEQILARPAPPDHIVIETSGLALPKPLVKAFNWPEVRTRVTVDGVIAVVDGPAVADGLFAHDRDALEAQRQADPMLDHDSPLEELFEEQLGCADMVVINKMDLMDDAAAEAVTAEIRASLRPGVRILQAHHGRIDADILLGLAAAAESDLDARHSHHDGHDDEDHDHDHDDFVSFAIALGEVAAPEELTARIARLVEEHDVLRVKGFAAVAGKPMRLVVQGVGARIASYYDRAWQESEARESRLVVIGLAGLDEAAVRRALAA
jgi:cobalamin biosynthesis protein CobW